MICEETAGFGLQASGFRLILSAVLVSLTIVVSVRAESSPSANVRFAGSDEATVGQKLPVALQLANTSAADIRQVRIKTNQLFEYRLDVLIPARETGDVTFEPWYFDGSLKLSAIEGLDGAGQVAVRYEPAELKPRVGAVGTSSEDMPAEQAWHPDLKATAAVRPYLSVQRVRRSIRP